MKELNKRERKKKQLEHNKNINVRMNEELFSAVDNVAIKHDLTRSDVIRLMIENKLDSYAKGATLEKEDVHAIRELLIDLRESIGKYDTQFLRLSNNYNQIAKHLNTTKDVRILDKYEQDFKNMLKLLGAIDNHFDTIVQRLVVLDDI